jgi:hypothetical protein
MSAALLEEGLQVLALDQLQESDDNPREITPEALQRLQYSLEHAPDMLQARPIIATPDGRVVAGNMRLRGLHELGVPESWVFVKDLDEATRIEWMLRDNQEYGDWVPDELASMIARHAELEGDSLMLGFEAIEIEELLSRAAEGDGSGGLGGQVLPGPSLADRFVVPPFSVLDARSGPWQERKREWLQLGIQSEVGRDGQISRAALHSISGNDPQFYEKKRAKEDELGRTLTTAEFISDHYEGKAVDSALAQGGTSVFDPVLCELVYRWFSAAGHSVLDPFAGGSVRGIVAARLGRAYTGVDLRQDQVDANREQAAQLLGGAAPAAEVTVDNPGALTPIEQHGDVYVKRDDLFSVAGVPGGKARTCLALAMLAQRDGCGGLVTAGSRQSPQANIVAAIGRQLGMPVRVHTPSGPVTPELAAAMDAGAERVAHQAGRNSVIIHRARKDAEDSGWFEVPFGMECQEAVEQTRRQVDPTQWPDDLQRLVVPVGSGMSLAGVLWGLQDAGLGHLPVLGVQVGADPRKRLEKYAPPGWQDQVELVVSELDYHDHAPDTQLGDLQLDPVYEAKCLPYLQPGDLLWVVGIRASAGAGDGPAAAADQPMPVWHQGDAAALGTDALSAVSDRGPYDLVFSCPPYFDLELYSDDPRDLSRSSSWGTFKVLHEQIIKRAVTQLRDDRFAVWVVGDVREKGTGVQLPLGQATIEAFENAGCRFYNEAILVTPVGSLRIRAGKAFVDSRKLGRTHQQVLVFVKGDPKAATAAAGVVDLVELEQAAEAAAEQEG